MTSWRRVVRPPFLGLLATSFALATAAPALAATGGVISHPSWLIVSGAKHTVKPGGTYTYCASRVAQAVRGIQANFTVPRSAWGKQYSTVVVGPADAGSADRFVGRVPSDRSPENEYFVNLDFPNLRSGGVDLPPGTYRLTLRLDDRLMLNQTVTLVARTNC
jgi:hypothetical protein